MRLRRFRSAALVVAALALPVLGATLAVGPTATVPGAAFAQQAADPVAALTSPQAAGGPADQATAAAGSGLDPAQVVGPPAGAPLAGAELYQLTERVAGEMRCPVCQGLSVADSQTPTALAMKAEVRQMLAAGYSEDQVLAYFEESYGEFIRLAPKAEGFNLVVWILPVVGVLAGLALIVGRMRRKPAPTEAVAEALAIDPALEPYLERVRREVAS